MLTKYTYIYPPWIESIIGERWSECKIHEMRIQYGSNLGRRKKRDQEDVCLERDICVTFVSSRVGMKGGWIGSY